jgi:nitrite reductase (NADH) large subunit
MRRVLVFESDRCLACRSCELACAVAHSGGLSLAETVGLEEPPLRRVRLAPPAEGGGGLRARRCDQCLEPLCVFACKSGALSRDLSTGRVLFEEERCLGCWMCVMVCEGGVRADLARHRAVRCDLCEGRETPACVLACPTRTLSVSEPPDERPRTGFSGELVVVGSSAAGIAACEAAREFAPGAKITLVTADADPPTSRPLLSYALAGAPLARGLAFRAEGYLEALGVRVLASRRAMGLDAGGRRLFLDGGGELRYDQLVLATGARAASLEIQGASLDGVRPLRDLLDLERIDRLARPGGAAVVLGGGNVGLQVCEALLARGLRVTVVVKSPHLLSQMVDEEAGRRVGELFAAHGLVLRTGRDAISLLGEGHVSSVRLDDGEELPADLVVVGKGIRPDVAWLAQSGLALGRGIPVDDFGRTSLEHVFAAGDCAEALDPLTGRAQVAGVWPVAHEMGRAAGATAVGVPRRGPGALRLNASNFFGVPIISIGEVREARIDGARAEVQARTADTYRKLVFIGERLVGALLVGEISGAGTFFRLYRGEGPDRDETPRAAGPIAGPESRPPTEP